MRSAIHVIRRIHVLDCGEHFSGGGEHAVRRCIVCVVCLYRSSALPTGYPLLPRASSPFATRCPISLIRPTFRVRAHGRECPHVGDGCFFEGQAVTLGAVGAHDVTVFTSTVGCGKERWRSRT
ncbi:MAG: hypothetical protein ABIU05_14455, partial [Nitrospirales bacterium]